MRPPEMAPVTAGRRGVGGRGPDPHPGARHDPAHREVRRQAGQRHEPEQQEVDGVGRRPAQDERERRERDEPRRGVRGRARSDLVPPGGVARPQVGHAVGRGDQRAAEQHAVAEQPAHPDRGEDREGEDEQDAGLPEGASQPGGPAVVGVPAVGVVGRGVEDRAAGVADLATRDEVEERLEDVAGLDAARGEELPDLRCGHGPGLRRRGRDPRPGGAQPRAVADRVAERTPLVTGVLRRLGEQQAHRADQRAEQQSQGDVGAAQAGGVRPHEVDRGDAVDAVRAVRVLRGAGVDGSAAVGGRLAVVHHGGGRDDDPVAGAARAPAEVDVVAEHRERGVEAAELVPHLAAHEHARAADGEDVADVVVLPLVELAPLETGHPVGGPGDGHADLDEDVLVAPAAQLRADDVGRARPVGVPEQPLERGRRRSGVVVQDPGPPHGVGTAVVGRAGRGGQGRRDGGAEAALPGQGHDAVDEPGVRGASEDVGGGVGGPGVDGDDAVGSTRGARQRGERRGQPAGAVVGDDDRRDAVVPRRESVVLARRPR